MHLTLGELIVWLIVGALAGNVAGRLVTLRREGLGRWTNLGVGMGGALVGGFVFNLFDINLGLDDLGVKFQDLISALLGALVLMAVWAFVRWRRARSRASTNG
jgi:uncharacterized membrane protein YeaQ/YmgE (transglycosylase-associated protein family)